MPLARVGPSMNAGPTGRRSAMARFVSIGRLERGEPRVEAEVRAVRTETSSGTRWVVVRRGDHTHDPISLPDNLFRELYAPDDPAARRIFGRPPRLD